MAAEGCGGIDVKGRADLFSEVVDVDVLGVKGAIAVVEVVDNFLPFWCRARRVGAELFASLRQSPKKQKSDFSIRLINGFDALGDEVLEAPEVGVVEAHLFEVLDG